MRLPPNFPSINGDGKYQRELYSKNGIISLLSPLLGPAGSGGVPIQPINEYTVGLDMSWELDLWGRVRRQVEAADAQVDQAEDRRRDALVSSFAELARNYIQLRGTQDQIRIAENNLRVDRDILQLAQQLQQKGVRSGLDAENAAAQVEGIRAQLPSLQQQQIQYQNAIALLLDMPPTSLNAELGPSARSAAAGARSLGAAVGIGAPPARHPRGRGSIACRDRQYRRCGCLVLSKIPA